MPFVLVDGGEARCSIVTERGVSRVVRFAVSELRRYVKLMTGAELGFEGGEDRRIRIVSPTDRALGQPQHEDDTFRVEVTGAEVVISGESDRAILYAAYYLLEQMGVEFWDFGPEGENVPRKSALELTEGSHATSPAFAVRSIATDTGTLAYPLEKDWPTRFYFADFWDRKWAERVPEQCVELTNREFLRLVDWMGKHRLNSLFPAHYVAWGVFAGPLREAMADRGIMLEMPGHALPALLPRELFATEPELFCMRDGQRHDGGNFCTSNPRTLQIVQENALRMVEAHPEVRIIHCWADDVGGGSWCSCPLCRDMPAYEQSMRAANAVANAVRDRYPHLLVDFLAYHDTSAPAGNAKPAPNLSLMYAPRQRCYAHPMGDPDCPRNVEYAADFAAAIAPFGDRAEIFEYHCDNILFRNVAVPLMQTIAGDQRFYHAGGATMTQTLGFLQGSFWLYPLNYIIFAKTAWDPDTDPHEFLAGYCKARFGSADVAALFVEWEEILRRRLDLSGLSYQESPFADWAVPPMPDRSALWGADNLHLIVSIQDSQRSREWNVLPERLDAQSVLFRGAKTIAELEELLVEFRALGPAARNDVLALELSLLRLREFEETMWSQLAALVDNKRAEASRNEAAQAARKAAARYLLDEVPAELRGGWVDWWAKDVLGIEWP